MFSEIERFVFPPTGRPVRIVLVGGEPWFVGRDVALALGYANPRAAVAKHVPDRHRGESRIATPSGDQDMGIISEPGLYRLIMRSNAELAERFQEWVTADVLPSIRKTGTYSMQPNPAIPTSFAEALELAARQARAIEDRDATIAVLEPEAARAARTLDAHGLALVGTVAKRFGIRERSLREFLFAERLLIRVGSRRNEPYAEHIAAGRFELKARLIEVSPDRPPEERSTTYVTPRGEAFIWRRLYAAGLVSTPQIPAEQLQLGA